MIVNKRLLSMILMIFFFLSIPGIALANPVGVVVPNGNGIIDGETIISFLSTIVLNLFFVLLIEGGITSFWKKFIHKKEAFKIVLLMNIITNPLLLTIVYWTRFYLESTNFDVWFITARINAFMVLLTLVLEIIVIVVEGLILKKKVFHNNKAFKFSILINLTSFILGSIFVSVILTSLF